MKRGSIYPSWRYHKTEPPVLCLNAAHDDDLGSAWSDEDIREFPVDGEAAPTTEVAPAETPKVAPKKRSTRKK